MKQADLYKDAGFGRLLTKGDANPKTKLSNKSGEWYTTIMHFAPAKESGYQVCSSSTAGCRGGCLNTAGRGRTSLVQVARQARTRLFFENRKLFKEILIIELRSHVKRAAKLGKKPAVRLNGTSDVVWEKVWPTLFGMFSKVKFYDYTKHFKRVVKGWSLPPNYHLTFSRSENNDAKCIQVLADGLFNVAAVFTDKNYPPKLWGQNTYSMDGDDLRFLDPPGGEVGCLYAKGKAKHDTSGFVLGTDSTPAALKPAKFVPPTCGRGE